MKNIKMLIIIVCIVIAILITTILLVININNNSGSVPNEISSDGETYNLTKELQTVTIRNNFYTVKTCIEKFYNIYANIFNTTNSNLMLEGEALESIKREQSNNVTAIYNMLDEEYIEYANITKENLLNKLKKVNQVNVEIDSMYVSEQTENIYVYFAYGTLLDTNTAESQQFSMIVKTDMQNKTFKVYLQDYIKAKYSNIKIGDNIQISVGENIKNDIDNTYQYKVINDEAYITEAFNNYAKNLLYNKSRAYKLLNSEYSSKKFKSQQEFENYIKNNLYKFATMKLSKYQKTKTTDYTQYICIDQNNNYYIFREKSVMQYNVILDTYTVDLPEFTERYASSKDEEKVLLNIQKCFEAINNKDYGYVYNKLDQTFKANNFKTLTDFEKYMKANTFELNSVSSSNGKVQGNTYMYDITIKDSSGKNNNTIKKTFVMQLKEGTDFVMSFEV